MAEEEIEEGPPPEKIRKLTARLAKLREQREVIVARYAARLKKLNDQLVAITDEKALLITHRDEELLELENELKAIGAVAG